MSFVNEEIDISHLPKVDTLEIKGLERNYILVSIFGTLLFFLIAVVAFVSIYLLSNSFKVDIVFWSILGVILLIAGVATLLSYLGFKIKGYSVREKDIHYRKGLLFRSMISIPFNRIQHCEVSESFLDRMFDLAKLKIYTAGGSNSDLVIPGLPKESAHELRAMILSRSETKEKEIVSEIQPFFDEQE